MLPKKLKDDAITEAVYEIRFERGEGDIAEAVLGRLLDFPAWASIPTKSRLKTAEIPAAVRESQPVLKYQPIMELSDPKGRRLIRIGSNIASLHFKAPYPGWNSVLPDIETLAQAVCGSVRSPQISRLGLRYINALTSNRHKLQQLFDLEVALTVKGKRFDGPVFLTYRADTGLHKTITRLVSPAFVTAAVPETTTAMVDIDVSLMDGADLAGDPGSIVAWFDRAHTLEKEEFFRLLPEALTKELAEE